MVTEEESILALYIIAINMANIFTNLSIAQVTLD